MNAKQSYLEASVIPLAAPTATAPVSKGLGVEQFASRPNGLLRWLDHWFRASPEERMRNASLAYWS